MTNKKRLPPSDEPQRLPPKQVVKMLKGKRTIVSIAQAEEILKFMRKMAKIAVTNYLDQHDCNAGKETNDKV